MTQSKSLLIIIVIFLGNTSCPLFAQGNGPDPGSVQNRFSVQPKGNSGDDMSCQAQLLSTSGRYGEAEQLFKAALAYWDKNPQANQKGRPHCLNNFGLLYANQRKYDQAIPLYKEALSFEEKLLPDNDPLVALTLDNMAQAYRLQGELQEAEPLYVKALAIEEKSMSPDDQDHAITMFNLSLLYFQLEKYDKCEPLMVQSLVVLKKTLGETNPDYLSVYKYYPALLRKTNRSQQADVLESEAQTKQNQ